MSKKHFIAMANWIAAHTAPGSRDESIAIALACEIASQFNPRFDAQRFVAWVQKQQQKVA